MRLDCQTTGGVLEWYIRIIINYGLGSPVPPFKCLKIPFSYFGDRKVKFRFQSERSKCAIARSTMRVLPKWVVSSFHLFAVAAGGSRGGLGEMEGREGYAATHGCC